MQFLDNELYLQQVLNPEAEKLTSKTIIENNGELTNEHYAGNTETV